MSLDKETDLKETELLNLLVEKMNTFGLKEKTIRAIVTSDLLPTNDHLEKMLLRLNSLNNPTDEVVISIALIISESH